VPLYGFNTAQRRNLESSSIKFVTFTCG